MLKPQSEVQLNPLNTGETPQQLLAEGCHLDCALILRFIFLKVLLGGRLEQFCLSFAEKKCEGIQQNKHNVTGITQ